MDVNIKTEDVNINTDGRPYESRWTSTAVLMDVCWVADGSGQR